MVFGDGTFEYAPSVFYQLYTFHAQIGTNYPPMIYFFLPNKTTKTYERMLDIVLELCPQFRPSTFLVDYEMAMLKALRSKFGEATIKGCYFHFTQCIRRKAIEKGLKKQYESVPETRLMIRSLMALAFVPVEDVVSLYKAVKSQFPKETAYEELALYFKRTFVKANGGGDPLFPPHLWNHFASVESNDPRTSNCCEGFHNTLNSVFVNPHPSIREVLEGLEGDAFGHCRTYIHADHGRVEKRPRRDVYRDEALAKFVGKYPTLQTQAKKIKHLKKIANLD